MFNDVFKGKKVIITGNTGFKGSWLSLWLYSMGAMLSAFQKIFLPDLLYLKNWNWKKKRNIILRISVMRRR